MRRDHDAKMPVLPSGYCPWRIVVPLMRYGSAYVRSRFTRPLIASKLWHRVARVKSKAVAVVLISAVRQHGRMTCAVAVCGERGTA